jgi:hypothetical protein
MGGGLVLNIVRFSNRVGELIYFLCIRRIEHSDTETLVAIATHRGSERFCGRPKVGRELSTDIEFPERWRKYFCSL